MCLVWLFGMVVLSGVGVGGSGWEVGGRGEFGWVEVWVVGVLCWGVMVILKGWV